MRTALFGLEKAGIYFTSPPFFILHVLFDAYAAELSPVVAVSPVAVSLSFASSFISVSIATTCCFCTLIK